MTINQTNQKPEPVVIEKDSKRFIDDPEEGLLEIKYGLPATVAFCKRCVISNQRPSSTIEFKHRAETERKSTIGFDEDGICSACRVAEQKKEIDWEERERALIELCDRFRSRNGSYDCLVPGSGGKDSAFASHILKSQYGMHPLTCTWAPHRYTDIGWKNFQNWVDVGGFDNYLFTADGETHRTLTRLSYLNLCHPFQAFIIGQKNFAPRVALRMGIPLVFYGEHEAEYGNNPEEFHIPTRDSKYFVQQEGDNEEPAFGGVPLSGLREYGIEPGKLDVYLPLSQAEHEASEIEIHYLGYYKRWTPQECYYYAVENTGFEANPERTEGTYSKYNSLDDRIDGLHYWTTFIKFGIGRATYDASQEVRNDHIIREEGVALINRFDGEFPKKYYREMLDYMGITDEQFWEVADNARSPHLWRKVAGGWEQRHKIDGEPKTFADGPGDN